MLYLFLMSIVPTVPAGWLTFAEGIVYSRTTPLSRCGASALVTINRPQGQ